MTKKEYNQRRDICINSSCYHCTCNGTDKCFKTDISKIIKDFPNRHFDILSEKEQNKILALEIK